MKTDRRLFVRVDATTQTGLGHFNRCLALAQRWREAHGPAVFIGRVEPGLIAKLDDARIEYAPLEFMHPDTRDLKTTLARIDASAIVVLDGYQFDYAYQRGLADGHRLLVVDDLGHLPRYAGTWLLNASVNADEIVYAEAPAHRLLGPKYALLRRELLTARSAASRSNHAIETILVSLGGADAPNDTLRVLQALAAANVAVPRVRVIVGPLNPHAERLAQYARTHSGMEIVRDPPSMPDELVRADFAVTSAGTISTELVYLGIPALLLGVADNQLGIGASLDRRGVAIYGGDIRALDADGLAAAIRAALADVERHASIRRNAPELVDGLGAVRTCNILSGAENV